MFAVIHLSTVQWAASTGDVSIALALYAMPAVITLICRPTSRRHFYRFPVPMVLAYVTYSGYQVTIYLLAITWLIRQSWFVDTDPGDRTPWAAVRALSARMRRIGR